MSQSLYGPISTVTDDSYHFLVYYFCPFTLAILSISEKELGKISSILLCMSCARHLCDAREMEEKRKIYLFIFSSHGSPCNPVDIRVKKKSHATLKWSFQEDIIYSRSGRTHLHTFVSSLHFAVRRLTTEHFYETGQYFFFLWPGGKKRMEYDCFTIVFMCLLISLVCLFSSFNNNHFASVFVFAVS